MRILVLASSRYAPTYNEKLLSQVAYINKFENMEAEIYNDMPLHEIEEKLLSHKYDVVFPAVVFDYTYEDTFPYAFNCALYNLLLYHNQEYIGSDVYSQLLLNDKALTNHRSGMGLPYFILTRALWENKRQLAIQSLQSADMEWPVIVKPNTLSASMGITPESVAYSMEQIEFIINKQFKQFKGLSELLIEKYLQDAREYTVSVTGNGEKSIACATAVISKNEHYQMYSYSAKNMSPDSRPIYYGEVLDPSLKQTLLLKSKQLADIFKLRDYCRFDFLVRGDEIYLIDGNTIPSLGYNYMFEYTDTGVLRLEQLLAILIFVFSRRVHAALPQAFVDALPGQILSNL